MNPLFERLEEELENYSALQRFLLLLFVALLIMGGGWYYVIAPRSEEIQSSQEAIEKLQRSITSTPPAQLKRKLSSLQKQNVQLQKEIQATGQRVRSLERYLQGNSSLRSSQERYLRSLEAILRYSVELGLRIDRVEEHNPSAKKGSTIKTPSLQEYKSIKIVGGGRYPRILMLSYFSESLDLPLRIENLRIQRDENRSLGFELSIGYYGVQL